MPSKPSMPESWRLARLGDVAEVNRGISWSREEESSVQLDGALPVVRIGNVQRDGFHMDATLYIRGVSTTDQSRHSVTDKTLVMVGSNGNPDRVGNVFLANDQVTGHLLASFLIRIVPAKDVSEHFLSALMRSDQIQGRITESTSGSTGLRNLSLEWLRDLTLSLPPLPEQRAIAAVLDSIDDAIEGADAVIAATERLRDSLLHELLTRGVPGRHSEWKEAPGVGMMPASWEVVRLGDVADVAFSSVDKKTVDGEVPVELCNYTDVFYNRRIRLGMGLKTATASLIECDRWALRKGDVLFTKDSETPDEIGIPAYVTADMPKVLCGYHLGLARPHAELTDGAFLAELLRSPRTAGQFARIANGVTRFGLTLGPTNSLTIPLPSLAEQQAIAAVLDGVDEAIELARSQTNVLRLLKESAADALLTGRVRVGGRSMLIAVNAGDWGDIRPDDIRVLLADVASYITPLLREPPKLVIVVSPTASADDDPITLWHSSPRASFRILLSARGNYWCQFAYQFSHELCHVLSNYMCLLVNPNNWFHEAICELASVFTLRRMAQRWLTNPPYPGRFDYAESLARYADDLLSREARQLPAGVTLSTWLASEEGSLRQDSIQRDKNAVVAYLMLPIFESDPAGWNAIRNLPNSSGVFKDYLRDWYSQVESIDKPFVNRIIQLFEG